MSDKPAYRPDIDGLRAIAVLAVLLYHFDFRRLAGGFVGVDVFFVISGYLITGIVLREIQSTGRLDFVAFYERRVRRLFPSLFVTIAGTALAAYALLSPSALVEFLQSAVASVFGAANVFFWLQTGYFDSASLAKPLLHMWSLGVEEQFYLVWPFALLLAVRLLPRNLPLLFGLMFVASFAASLLVMQGFPGQSILTEQLADGQSIAFYLTPFRGFEFIIGAALVLLPKARTQWAAEACAALGLAMIALAVLMFNEATPFPSYNALIPAVGAALAIYGGQSRYVGAVLRFRPLVWVGLISYSLYLVHWPLVSLYRYGRPEALIPMEKVGLVVASVILAAAMFKWVEQPFRSKSSLVYPGRKQLFGGATAGAALIIALWGIGSDGAPYRFPHLPFTQTQASVYGGEDCPYPGCVSTGEAARPVLVVGDSFARQLHAGLIAAFPNQTFEFWDQRTCATWSLTWAQWNDRPNHAEICREARTQFLERLEAGQPVILASHWDNTTELYDASAYDQRGEIVRKSLPREQAYVFAAREIAALADKFDASVMVVANPPDITPIGDLETCLVRSLRNTGVECQHTPLTLIGQRREMARALAGTGVPVVDAFAPFCDESDCLNFDSGGFFYSDAYHLSRRGSELLIQNTRQDFARFLASATDRQS